jgi:hypothetical protein
MGTEPLYLNPFVRLAFGKAIAADPAFNDPIDRVGGKGWYAFSIMKN